MKKVSKYEHYWNPDLLVIRVEESMALISEERTNTLFLGYYLENYHLTTY